MFSFGKQKFCNYCDMPIEDCECENCENCGKLPQDCNCEICHDCNNFVEYCECLDNAIVKPSVPSAQFCSDCGMHSSECTCDVEKTEDAETEKQEETKGRKKREGVCSECGKKISKCKCEHVVAKVEDSTLMEVDGESQVIVIEEPPSLATKAWRVFMTLSTITAIFAVGLICYFVYDAVFKEEEPTNLSVEEKFNLSSDILSMMYNVRDVQDVINNQEDLMSRLDASMYPKLDASNETLYLRRYGSFSNSSISIMITNYTKSKSDNQIVVNYTITPVADLPVTRMAIMEFNMDKKLTSFFEYTVNEIK